jgi:glycosyltransferase involved in cell wall biosynthesis
LKSRVGIVVPTLGKRPDYLLDCLSSIRNAVDSKFSVFVIVVAPESFNASIHLESGLVQSSVIDPGEGLAEAINAGFLAMPSDIEFINWLGDDDLLMPGCLEITASILENNPDTVLVFGGCEYVDAKNRVVWVNRSGSWASPLLRFGPQLIPQPGSLFRASAFSRVGGLDTTYDWAFDFDLLIKMSKIGKLKYVDEVLARFRWHPESLSVEFRKMSVTEASKVRTSHLPALLRPFSCIWEYPVKQATLYAGNRVTLRAKKKSELD